MVSFAIMHSFFFDEITNEAIKIVIRDQLCITSALIIKDKLMVNLQSGGSESLPI